MGEKIMSMEELEKIIQGDRIMPFKVIIPKYDQPEVPAFLVAAANIFHDGERKIVLLQVDLYYNKFNATIFLPRRYTCKFWELINKKSQMALFDDIYVYNFESWIIELAKYIHNTIKPTIPSFSSIKSVVEKLTRNEIQVFTKLFGLKSIYKNSGYPTCMEDYYYYHYLEDLGEYIVIHQHLGYSDDHGRVSVFKTSSLADIDP
jgi:hypothetical protein